jgi:hypothetical protein
VEVEVVFVVGLDGEGMRVRERIGVEVRVRRGFLTVR